MKNAEGSGIKSLARRAWRIIRWPLAVLVVLYIALLVWRYPSWKEEQRTPAAVAAIHAQKLTMDDVDGKHLPPPPDPAQVDATVAGVDANGNGIRDDVELAIFKKYPNSPYTRAAELQYAMAEQMFLTRVFNSETWKAVSIEDDRGYQCIAQTYPRDNLEIFNKITDTRVQEVKDLVFNTVKRQTVKAQSFGFATSFGLPDENFCDVDLTTS